MTFPERFKDLPEYAFPRLRRLLDAHAPGGEVIHMTIGEPKHPFPDWVGEVLAENLAGFGGLSAERRHAGTAGGDLGLDRRGAMASTVGPERLMVLNGSREGLFAACVALCPETKAGKRPVVLMPNPFYQVYAVAALAVGAEPVYVPATAATGFLPDYAALPTALLDRVAVAYICSPSNPQGAVASRGLSGRSAATWPRRTISRCSRTNAIPRSSAMPRRPACCRSPPSIGADPERVVVFNSLSKRSNMPGLRSGFVAAGPQSMRRICGSCAPMPARRCPCRCSGWPSGCGRTRRMSRRRGRFMRAKFDMVDADLRRPAGLARARRRVLPVAAGRRWRGGGAEAVARDRGAGAARRLSRAARSAGENPGRGYMRVALVAPEDELQRGLTRLRDCLM